MRINHLIIGVGDMKQALDFYENLLGFKSVNTFVDTGTGVEGQVLTYTEDQKELQEILLVPFKAERLPNPQHVSFEVHPKIFDEIYNKAKAREMDVRAEPPLNSPSKGIGGCNERGQRYARFYVLDPGRVNVEIMKRMD
jgi:catechol 2,3-dioxygenase-like lactoylglutathione lyase family enzyme